MAITKRLYRLTEEAKDQQYEKLPQPITFPTQELSKQQQGDKYKHRVRQMPRLWYRPKVKMTAATPATTTTQRELDQITALLLLYCGTQFSIQSCGWQM